MTRFTPEWMGVWQQKVNSDPVFGVIGKYMDCCYALGFGERQYAIMMHNGKIETIVDLSVKDVPWQFALRGVPDAWEKFTQSVPPPMYNDIWAMAHPLHQKLRIEGDTKAFWQNVRALTWMLDLMREI